VASIVITESEILDALAAAAPGRGPKEARTILEMEEETGIDARKIRRALRLLKANNRLATHRIQRERLNGTSMTYVGFTVLPPQRKAAKR
jgi:transcription initiation factor IIE alpha subunit